MVRPPGYRKLAWVDSVDAACWVSGPDGRIVSINTRALELLKRQRSECVDRPCDDLLGGTDPAGASICSAHCVARRNAEACVATAPLQLVARASDGTPIPLLVWVATVRVSDRLPACLVHVALPQERESRLEHYLARVAGRTPGAECDAHLATLSAREQEILEGLASDLTLRGVALRLGVSYATVRNHVQHILAKLEAHSMAEAVARWVLRG
ncbi:MAG: PAS and helix-turn-helix domain-containing protein [Candidatus Eisenbacteria bacterium]